MYSTTLLIDIILLLLLESKLNMVSDTTETIRALLGYYEKVNERWNTSDDGLNMKLITMITSLIADIDNSVSIDVDRVVRTLMIEAATNDDLDGDEDLKETISLMIRNVSILTDEDKLDYIKNLKKSILEIYNREKLKRLLQASVMSMNGRSNQNLNFSKTMSSLRESFDKIEEGQTQEDDAVMMEVDLSSLSDEKIAKQLESSIVTKHIFKTGWKGINRMYQGGIRVPEYRSVGALTHNYKSGYELSIFASVALYNNPMVRGKGKPLMVYFSFEDDLIPIFEFLYALIYITETGKVLTHNNLSTVDMLRFVSNKLQSTGFEIKILKINPTEYSYAALVNKIKKYISQGYDVQVVDVDYMEKLPTTGIATNGTTGYDKKVLIRKMRNFMAGIECASSTPWQLSPAASNLVKDGLTDKDFLHHIHNKQYYQGSSTLGNEMDLETFTNKVETSDNGDWLNVHIGKHKIPTVVDKKYKSYFLPFPSNGPIPFDYKLEKEIGAYDVKTPNPFY